MTKENIIWQDISFYDSKTIEKWKKEVQEDYPDYTDEEIMDIIYEDISMCYDEEVYDLSQISLPEDIICIGRLGLWNGTFDGYKEYPDLKSCFSGHDGDLKFYVDENGDLRAELAHHDGTNHYLFRMWRSNVSETSRENLIDKIYYRKYSQADVSRSTVRIGDFIGERFGWSFKGRKPKEFLNYLAIKEKSNVA